MKCLIVKEKWLNLILDGDKDGPKLWEIRGSGTQVRGRVGLIQSGTGLVVGSVEIAGSSLLLEEDYKMFPHLHKIEAPYCELPYKEPHIWYLKDARRFKEAIPYQHPQGAVIWVNLPEVMEV